MLRESNSSQSARMAEAIASARVCRGIERSEGCCVKATVRCVHATWPDLSFTPGPTHRLARCLCISHAACNPRANADMQDRGQQIGHGSCSSKNHTKPRGGTHYSLLSPGRYTPVPDVMMDDGNGLLIGQIGLAISKIAISYVKGGRQWVVSYTSPADLSVSHSSPEKEPERAKCTGSIHIFIC
jgi:hypothetical protein